LSLTLSIPVIFCPVSVTTVVAFLCGGQILVGIENDRADLIWLGVGSVEGKVAADKSSFAIDHVTVRALCFAEEENFPLIGIAGELDDISSCLAGFSSS
jgi:hypothetical protein